MSVISGRGAIIDALLTRLTPQVDEILLNIAPGSSLAEDIFKRPTHRPAHISVVEDLYSSFSGPLAGIASSMQPARTQFTGELVAQRRFWHAIYTH